MGYIAMAIIIIVFCLAGRYICEKKNIRLDEMLIRVFG